MRPALPVAALLLLIAHAARAGDQPLYQPAPAWVTPAPSPPADNAGADGPQTAILDTQARLENGLVWTYQENAQRAGSADVLNRMGQLALEWAPDHGDLIIHGVDIIRDGKRIDVLGTGTKFTVLRREANLERRMLDGMLTATLAVEGLRVGDLLDLRYSITSKDAALKGNMAAEALVVSKPARVGFGRARLLWPSAVKAAWTLYPVGATPTETVENGLHQLVITYPLPQQPDPAPQAPGRFARPPIVEVSSFAGWQAVSKVMAPLYATDGLIAPGSALAQEVSRIEAAATEPRARVLLALQLVQDKVRYFARTMNGGNYQPQLPEQTWAVRYGDCKAKTLLLLAMLHALHVDAEPALANLTNGDLVQARLPSIIAFDHVFVLAHLGGQTLWLDGTGLGAKPEDLDDVPPYHWVLPVRDAGAALLEAPHRAPARPGIELRDVIDLRGGIDLAAPVTAELVIHGALAGQYRTMLAGLDDAGREKFLVANLNKIFSTEAGSKPRFAFDETAGTATISMTGIGKWRWTHADRRYTLAASTVPVETPPDRSRAIWKALPIDAGRPSNLLTEKTILLPDGGRGFSLDGSPAMDVMLPGNRHVRTRATLSGGKLDVTTRIEAAGGEIDPAALPDLRAKIADIRNHALKLRTEPDYPSPWHGIEAAKRARLYDPALQVFAQSIAAKPDDAGRYLARAEFLATLFERREAIADLDRALALQADVKTYRLRASLFRDLGEKPKAIADLKAANELDPGDTGTLTSLARTLSESGAAPAALSLLDQAIDSGGDNAPVLMAEKADVQADAGHVQDALATMESAVDIKPGNARLLNARCWLKAAHNVDLEAAVKDCSRAIELSEQVAPIALDSRAMAYFRQGKLTEALADLDAAIDARPAQAASLYLRAQVERKLGQTDKAGQDVADARLISPRVDEEYGRYGLAW